MITAFLFWGRVLDEKFNLNWKEFYIGRLFRITPLYWLAVIFLFVLLAVKTNFNIHVPLKDLVEQVFIWILPGTVKIQPLINGYEHTRTLIAGVTWTLYYEWLFYLFLPVMVIFARRKTIYVLLPIIIAFLFAHKIEKFLFAMFLIGMLSAEIIRKIPKINGDGKLKSAIALMFICATLFGAKTAYSWSSVILLGAFFYLVSSGASLFGLLKTKSAIRLGHISYGIYILQGAVLTVILSPVFLGDFSKNGPMQFWLTNAVIAFTLVVISALAYFFIEKPGIRLGKSVVKRYLSGKSTISRNTGDEGASVN